MLMVLGIELVKESLICTQYEVGNPEYIRKTMLEIMIIICIVIEFYRDYIVTTFVLKLLI